MSIQRDQYTLGTKIAEMYIAAQGVSRKASYCACDAMKEASVCMKDGFNTTMRLAHSEGRVELLVLA